MTLIKYRISGETVTMEAARAIPTPVPGLLLTMSPGGCWSVTHERSGLAIACDDDGSEALGAFVLDIAHLADWTAHGKDLAASGIGAEVRRIRQRYPSLTADYPRGDGEDIT